MPNKKRDLTRPRCPEMHYPSKHSKEKVRCKGRLRLANYEYCPDCGWHDIVLAAGASDTSPEEAVKEARKILRHKQFYFRISTTSWSLVFNYPDRPAMIEISNTRIDGRTLRSCLSKLRKECEL